MSGCRPHARMFASIAPRPLPATSRVLGFHRGPYGGSIGPLSSTSKSRDMRISPVARDRTRGGYPSVGRR